MGLLQFCEPAQQRRRGRQRYQSRRVRVQHLPHRVNLLDLVAGEIADHRAAPTIPHDLDLALQLNQRHADDVSSCAEALDELVFNQSLAGAQATKEDVFLERTDDFRK